MNRNVRTGDDIIQPISHFVRTRRFAVAVASWLSIQYALAVASATAVGQSFGGDREYLIRKWETDEGLPENSATAIVQSAQGYLWIGTFAGLVRFDGVRFTVYDETNTPQLPSQGIVNLYLDRAGNLWISTLRGMAMLADNAWRTFGPADGWVGNFARTFAERANGDLLVTTFDGHVMEYIGDRFHSLPAPPGENRMGYFGFVDEAGRWCVAQHAFVGYWDGRHWQAILVPAGVPPAEIATATARDGGQWILLGRELRKLRNGEHFVHYTLEELSGGIWSMFEDSAANLWICSYNMGLYRVDSKGDLRHWSTDNGLTYNGVRCIFEDRERNIWVGTSGGGLMQFAIRRARGFGPGEGLPGRVVNSVSSDHDGNIWIATYDKGLYRWDGVKVTPVTLSATNRGTTLTQSVLADSLGRVWVGTFGEGLWRIENGQASCVAADVVGNENILALFEDSRGRIWCGGGQKVVKFEEGKFSAFGLEQNLLDGGVMCFAEDREGAIWMANSNRVVRLQESGLGEVTDEGGESIRRVLCLHADDTDGMWMGLARGGLLRWRNGRTARIDATNGLPVDSVHGIIRDHNGTWWLVTNRGVIRGEMADFRAAADGHSALVCQVLNTSDGLPTDQFPSGRQPIGALDAAGHLWFATQKGAATIDPNRFRVNATASPAVIEAMAYYSPSPDGPNREGRSRIERQTRVGSPFPQRVVLPPGSHRIEIRYTGLSLTVPAKVRFQVKLDGWDQNWQAVGNRRVASYHQLSPGEYVFHVRAANNDGVWNSSSTQLAFRLMPYFWQTIWFRSVATVLLVAGGSGVAWWGAHSRQRRRRQANEQFRSVVEAAPSAMIVVNMQGRMVLVNAQAEKVFGYNRDELIGKPIEMLVPARFRDTHPGYRNAYLANPSARYIGAGRDLFGKRTDDSEVAVEIGLTPFTGPQGRFVLASIVDITERRQREIELARERSALAHLSRVTMLGELSGSLAHELNQPLTAILSNAQAAGRFMAAEVPNLDEVREILAEIVEDNNRAGEVIRRLRALFRKGDMVFERLDLGSLVADVAKLLHTDAVLRHVDVVLELDPNLPLIQGDRIQLQQVMLNLLLNAFDVLHHSPANNPRVVVEARADGPDGVKVCVRDNGPGLSGDTLDRIFEPFFTTKATGMGMGLSISRSIIEAHGRTLRAENNPQGGATFWFTLPIDEKFSRTAPLWQAVST